MEVVRIFPCAGLMQTLDTLPGTSVAMLYASGDTLYVADPINHLLYHHYPESSQFEAEYLPAGFNGLRTLDKDRGKMYTLGGYPGLYETSEDPPYFIQDWVIKDTASSVQPFFPTDLISAEDNLVLGASRENRYCVWDLNNTNVFIDAVFTGLSGALQGVLLDEQGRIWTLSDQNELNVYEVHSGFKLASFTLQTDAIPLGLTRIRH